MSDGGRATQDTVSLSLSMFQQCRSRNRWLSRRTTAVEVAASCFCSPSIHLSLSSHLPSIQESTHPPPEEEQHKEEEESAAVRGGGRGGGGGTEVKNESVGLSSCSSSSSGSDSQTLKTLKTPFRWRESGGGRGRSRGSVSSQRPITGLHLRGDVINVSIRGGEGGGRERERERSWFCSH